MFPLKSPRAWIAVLAIGAALSAGGAEAATIVVTLDSTNAVFRPQTVTVRIGDTVTWDNPSTTGFHNVVSDDGTMFSSGAPATGPWTFSYTFTAAGTFGYYCMVHGSPGIGMFGTVVVLDSIELAPGSDMKDDLAGAPDRYRIGQQPYSSYEVVVDALAGNPALQLDRVDATGSTVIQSGLPVTPAIDMTQSLRWENPTAAVVDTERIRVGNSTCPGNCTSNDAYRIRAYETTLAIPRFNQSGTQVSVVILQNPSDTTVSGHVYFWSAGGSLLNAGGLPFTLPPKGALIQNAGAVPGVSGTAGTVTISHDGRYGELACKVVALEPATGFAFDTPAFLRAR
jgi:plastocyanin